ncbi:MCP four helix bundle domain-containing protein [Luteimonas cellulosilyticus]|uniref:MCP four helix bundle domain-containing protein n=1 Tax=Luteimonas cellulosilyticus TaxID=2683586 RepID=UPI00135B412C|nr:MCP four helix bundle domain-containing protein [Luteimonas cellulosilyticus]
MNFGNLRIGQRLAIGFSCVILLMVVLTAIGIHRVGRISDGLHTINDVNSVKQRHAINFRGSVHDRAIALRDVVLADGPDAVAAAEAQIDTLAGFYADAAAPLDARRRLDRPAGTRAARRHPGDRGRSPAADRPGAGPARGR